MATIIKVCESLLELAKLKYPVPDTSLVEDNFNLDQLASEALVLIENLLNPDSSERETVISLDIDCDDEIDIYENEDVPASENDANSRESGLASSQEWQVEKIGQEEYNLEEMIKIVNFYNNVKTNKLFQTQRRFPKVRSYASISRMKTYVDQNGKKLEKLSKVETFVKERFNHARQSLIHVSEVDLKRWGIIKSKDLSLQFKASSTWIHNFKKKNRIVSRKITKYLTKAEYDNKSNVEEAAYTFVENVNKKLIGVQPDLVLNFDQSGFTYEYSPKRTLSIKGEKDTLGLVVSHNANTHSYTVMPLLSMSGKFIGKLLICLQEPQGYLGPIVKKNLEVPSNIYLVASKSGKLDKTIMKKWITDCVAPYISENKAILIYDSWAGQVDDLTYESLSEQCTRFQIPAKATSIIQPLDKYIFRQYKIFRRKIFEKVVLDSIDIDLHKRQNVIKMQSLMYNQFQSAAFEPMFKYAWFACNYKSDRVKFKNVAETLFSTSFDDCEEEMCNRETFIKCAHCSVNMCFHHFYIDNHFHSDDSDLDELASLNSSQ